MRGLWLSETVRFRDPKGRLFGGASLAAAWLAASAAAAQVPPTGGSGQAETKAQAPADAANPGINTPSALETVVVTARRREERLIDVPVAASVLSRATLEKYATSDIIQLQTITPSVQIARTGGGTPGGFVRIRGIGVFGPDYSSEQPVGIIVDGVPVSRGHIIDVGFLDEANVQVLKGPQALFFGKNSPAGVIAIDSVNPGRRVEGYARVSYGFVTEDPVFEGAVSLPVGDKLSVRFALRGEDMQGGYVRNEARPVAVNPLPDPAFGGQPAPLPGANFKDYPQTKQVVGRFTALWKPTDNFDVTAKFLGGYTHFNSSFGNITNFNCGNAHPSYVNTLTQVTYVDPNAGCGFRFVTNDATLPAQILDNYLGAPKDGKYFRSARQFLSSLNANYRLDHVTLTSTTGYYVVRAEQFDNYDQTVFAETPAAQSEHTKTFTEELRAQSSFDFPINFTVGAYYEHENRQFTNSNRIFLLPLLPPGLPFQSQYAGISNSLINADSNLADTYSVFGQLSWKITPTIELAGGARYTKSNKRATLNVLEDALDIAFLGFKLDPRIFNPLSPAGTTYNVRDSYDDVSPEVTLSWKPRRNLLIYGAYKTGFLAGGIGNPGVVSNYTDFRSVSGVPGTPTYTQAQRNGILSFGPEKAEGEEFGVKGDFFSGRLTGDATYFHYKFTGIQIASFNPTTTTFTVGNAAAATQQGVDLNVNYRLTDHFALRGAISYVDLIFDDYKDAPCYPGQPVTVAPFCVAGRTQDLSGTRFGTAPLTANFGLTYNRTLAGKYDFTASSDVQTFSKSPPFQRQSATRIPAYTLLNAQARIAQSNGPWSVSLIGTNLTDELYISSVLGKPLGDPQDLIGSVGPGREIRLQADYRF